MNQRTIIALLVVVVCLGIVGTRFFGGSSAGKTHRRDLANELAGWIAKESAKGGKGNTLILAPVDEKRDPFPKQLATRLAAQLKDAGFDPITSVPVPYNTAMEGTGEPVTKQAFLDALAAHSDAAVVISLVGVPRFSAADLPAGKSPRLIVASTVIMPYLKSLPPGLLDFAIEVKRDRADPRTDPTLGELSNYFVLYRPK